MEFNSELDSNKTDPIVRYKYLGNGFVVGVPARNLTEKEFEKYKKRLEKYNALELYQKEVME